MGSHTASLGILKKRFSIPALIATSIAVFLGAHAANAQTITATNFVATSSVPSIFLGNVGIGTTNPAQKLQVTSGDSPVVRLEQNTSTGFTAQTWDMVANEGNFLIRDVTGGSKLPFRIATGAPTNSMRLDSRGYTGLATSSPWARLSVDTTGLAAGAASFAVGSPARADLVVTQAGNVGIGITNPDKVFVVSGIIPGGHGGVMAKIVTTGSFNGSGLALDATGSGNNNLGFQKNGVNKAGVGYDSRGFLGFANLAYSANDFSLRLGSDGSLTYNDAATSVETFRINANGNVGIGTASPAAKLDVQGSVRIGSPAAPKGITLYDTTSGSPFCLTIASGLVATNPGACAQ